MAMRLFWLLQCLIQLILVCSLPTAFEEAQVSRDLVLIYPDTLLPQHQDEYAATLSTCDHSVGGHCDSGGDTFIELNFGLSTPDLQRTEAIHHLQSVSDPDSPLFGQFWNHEQVLDHFAPPLETIQAVSRWLNEYGIPRSSIRVSADRTSLSFNTTVSQAQNLLNVDFESGESAAMRPKHNAGDSAGRHLKNVDYRAYHIPLCISNKVDLVVARAISTKRSSATLARPGQHSASSPAQKGRGKGGILHKKHWHSAREGSGAIEIDCLEYMSPDCLRSLYNIPASTGNTVPHSRSSLGIYETAWSTWLGNDLDTFFTSLEPRLVNHRPGIQAIDGGYRYLPDDPTASIPIFNLEADLDFEYAMSLAHPVPVIDIQVGDEYLLGNTNLMLAAYDTGYCHIGLDPAYDAVYPDSVNAGQQGAYNASDCGRYANAVPLVISISAAWNEASFSAEYAQRQCEEFLKLALQGTTVIVATGDYGTADQELQCLDPLTGVANVSQGHFSSAFPASCPWVTAIGGTQWANSTVQSDTTAAIIHERSSASSTLPDEVVFSESLDGVPISSSGGFSNIFDRPFYQSSAVPSYLEHPLLRSHLSNLSSAGYFRPAGRGWPDVAAMAKNYLVALEGDFYAVGGTSAAAPVFASMVARINDARLRAGKGPVGFINPVLYSRTNHILRNDVVSGSNSGCGVDEAFPASVGWDAVTGLGTMDFKKLMELYMSLP